MAAALLLVCNVAGAQTVVKDAEKFAALSQAAADYLKPVASIVVKVKVDSAIVNGKSIDIHFSKLTSDYSFRDNTVKDLYRIAKDNLPDEYKGMDVTLYANGSTLQELASKFYSEAYTTPAKPKKVKKAKVQEPALVENVSKPFDIPYGLEGRHLAV